MYTTSHVVLDALMAAGVSHVFANFGSDHPGLIEAIAERRAERAPLPRIITCPHEMVGMSAAHGFYQATGAAQAVLVHVECGTQSLAGALHNARKGRIPMLVLAGMSPATQEGELRGSRNEFIHWLQDVHDQRGLVRGYMKYDGEIRTGRNAGMMIRRALQLACSDPKGPAYLMSAREVMEEEVPRTADRLAMWPPLAPGALAPDDAAFVARTLAAARTPLVVTSYLGRNAAAVDSLVRLCRRLGAGVLESVPSCVNYPHDDGLHQGVQWNEPRQNEALAAADVILVLDSDVPWIPTVNRPAPGATVLHIDVDPLKEQMPLWHIGAARSFQADAGVALGQILECLDDATLDANVMAARRAEYTARHELRLRAQRALEQPGPGDRVAAPYLMACLRKHLDEDTTVMNEAVTHYNTVSSHLAVSRPGGMFASGGGSLGWNGGAALGVKLARPDRLVIAVTGDGSYMFSSPSTVHWMARRYSAPLLQIVLNNHGWRAPRQSLLGVHPDGYASRASSLDLSFDPPPDYAGIAEAAGGAAGFRIRHTADVEPMLAAAVRTVREEQRSAVVDVSVDG
jgi:acetolactate synthase-1/2/3 large subunit